MKRKDYPAPRLTGNEVDEPAATAAYRQALDSRRSKAIEDLRGAGDDVLAWYYARARSEAAERVADEREHAAAKALREQAFSIREIADIMQLPSTRVTRLLAGSPDHKRRQWAPIHGHISSALVDPDDGLTGAEYRASHDAAFRAYVPAQGDYTMGYDGQSLATLSQQG